MRLSIVLASLVGLSYANVIPWNLENSFPGGLGDTVLVMGQSLNINQNISIPQSSTLILKANKGISFASGIKIISSTKNVSVLVWTNLDSDGDGSLQGCDKTPCIQLSGDSSLVKVVESSKNLAVSLKSVSTNPWLGAISQGLGSRTEHLFQLNSASDLFQFSLLTDSLNSPSNGWGVALGKNIALDGLWNPLRGKVMTMGKYTGYVGLSGLIDGQGFTLSNLQIKDVNSHDVGFVGLGVKLTIRDLGITAKQVTGKSNVGILVGRLMDGSKLDRVWTQGKVFGNQKVGGLVGEISQSNIHDGYSESEIEGHRFVGGLVGSAELRSTVKNAWATGHANGIDDLGGAIGYTTEDSRLSNAYWIESLAKSTGTCIASSCSSIALSNSALMEKSNFQNFDFDHIWRIQEDRDYPRFIQINLGYIDPSDSTSNQNAQKKQQSSNGNFIKRDFIVNGSKAAACKGDVKCFESIGGQ